MPKQSPKQQGQLDALCGVYAVVNAFLEAGIADKHKKKLFEECCKAINSDCWPDVLWKGTTFRQLRQMIRACLDEIDCGQNVTVDYPFRPKGRKPKSDQDFHGQAREILKEKDVACVILGLKKAEHWVAATANSASERIAIIDSNAPKIARKNTPTGESTTHVYSRRQMVVFRRVE